MDRRDIHSFGAYYLGLVGLVSLNAGDYILLIKKRALVGSIKGRDIYKITEFDVYAISKGRNTVSPQQMQQDEYYLGWIKSVLNAGSFYYSTQFDLTNCLQRQDQTVVLDKEFYKNSNDKFFWNKFLLHRFLSVVDEYNIHELIVPIIQGFVEIQSVLLSGKQIQFILMSRRSRYRQGPRYHSRGIDDLGNVSNFVETEQIVFSNSSGEMTSFVQIRGSIPLYWKQVINIKYQPELVIDYHYPNLHALSLHASDLLSNYGRVVMINLINKKGYESGLGLEFQKQVSILNNPRLGFVEFDFHHECRKMRWDRISLLLQELRNELEQQGFYRLDASLRVLRVQTLVLRSNCMDCLDRTNVVQSEFAKYSLEQQLYELGVIEYGKSISDFPYFHQLFKSTWADHADEISLQYSGTGALKTDFTRTGKRTKIGMMRDLYNSILRYLLNNFMDGYRQDAIHLLSGQADIHVNDPTREPRSWINILVPLLLIYCILMTIVILFSWSDLNFMNWIVFLGMHLGMGYQCIVWIIHYGSQFTNNPNLNKNK